MEEIRFESISKDYLEKNKRKKTRESIGFNIVISALIISTIFILFYLTITISKIIVDSDEVISHIQKDSLALNPSVYLDTIKEIKASERNFMKETGQMVLLNFLLPIITGVTGFIFGIKGKNDND